MIKLNNKYSKTETKKKKKYGPYIAKKIPGGIIGNWYICGIALDLVNHKVQQVKQETGAVQYSKQSAIQCLLEELARIKGFTPQPNQVEVSSQC